MRQKPDDRLAVFEKVAKDAVFVERAVSTSAQYIAHLMTELHGEPFRVVIDHEVGMVLVRLE